MSADSLFSDPDLATPQHGNTPNVGRGCAPANTKKVTPHATLAAPAAAAAQDASPVRRTGALGGIAVDLPQGAVDVEAMAALLEKALSPVAAQQFRALYERKGGRTLRQIDLLVGAQKSTVQLQMLLDLQGLLASQLAAPRPEDLAPEYRATVEVRDPTAPRAWMGSLACIRSVIPHVIAKTPAKDAGDARKAWESYSSTAEPHNPSVYAFVGQFPMALSAEQIATLFFEVTGIVPLRVDHLPKGAKVFLRSWEEVAHAAAFNQTVQVCEYGTLIGRAGDAAEAAATREQLLTMRRLVDEEYRRVATRDVYALAHSAIAHAQRAKYASRATPALGYCTPFDAPAATAAPAKAPSAAEALVRFDQPAPEFKMARNGTYPMTIEVPAKKNKA